MSSRGIVVVGGGLAGAFTSYFLARLGAPVTLVERGEIGGQASGNNPGGLNPLHGIGIPGPMQALALESLRLHVDTWDSIRRLSGIDFAPRGVTRLHVALDERDVMELERARRPYDSTPGFSARWHTRDEMLALEPRLKPGILRGLSTEGDLRVDARAYTHALAGAAVRLGATTVAGEVRGLLRRGERVTGVLLESGALACDGVVMACGPWCAEPARWLDTPIPVEPVKGELLLVEPSSGAVDVDLVWRSTALYPTGADGVWVGGTEDRLGFDRAPSERARTAILGGLRELMPGIGSLRVIRRTAALRPVTPDGFPIVGMAPRWKNVCLALGGGRKGILLSAGMGRAAADLITIGATNVPLQGCGPRHGHGPPCPAPDGEVAR